MSMFYLERNISADDLQCPKCRAMYSIHWWTEYGDPIEGKHDVKCPDCGHKFILNVTTFIGYVVENEIQTLHNIQGDVK